MQHTKLYPNGNGAPRSSSSGLAGRSTSIGFAVECALQRPYFNAAGSGDVLTRGARGVAVEELQLDLRFLNYYAGAVDGIYGPVMEGAVEAFQSDNGLLVDGAFGENTATALCAALNGDAPGAGGGGSGSGSGGENQGGGGQQQGPPVGGGLFTAENLVYGGLGLATAVGVAAYLARD